MVGKELLAKGVGASPGTATGEIVFHSVDALELAAQGKPVILIRIDTTAEDVPAMRVVAGIITTHGGITGDAAIVARSLGKPCIAACVPLFVDYSSDTLTILRGASPEAAGHEVVLRKGAVVTINGANGEVWADSY
jgi:pyruvate,orthophosphate dikinase